MEYSDQKGEEVDIILLMLKMDELLEEAQLDKQYELDYSGRRPIIASKVYLVNESKDVYMISEMIGPAMLRVEAPLNQLREPQECRTGSHS